MARRRVIEDNVSHERWLVSYADFITLLFAFFVVMYSISQVNEGKYKVLSNTLTEAFNITEEEVLNTQELTLDPFQVGEVAKSNPLSLIELRNNAIIENDNDNKEQRDQQKIDNTDSTIETTVEPKDGSEVLPGEFQRISDTLSQALGDLINKELITIRGDEQWLEIELKSALLFNSGDANLSTPALEILSEIVGVVGSRTNLIRVEGFTDSIPVNTPLYPSNWELSTARAAAVVHLFVEEGIDPSRLAAIGYGQYQPLADDSTEQGRAANRRVVLRIAKEGELRPTLDVISTEQETASTQVSTAEQTQVKDSLDGVKTIELDGGGLLFTSDPGVQDLQIQDP